MLGRENEQGCVFVVSEIPITDAAETDNYKYCVDNKNDVDWVEEKY